MRQWLVPTECLCNQHLLGEHVECHMFIGTLKKKKSIQGYLRNKLLNPQTLYTRHKDLVIEMEKRGFKHKSILEKIKIDIFAETVDIKQNFNDLKSRCKNCKERIEQYEKSTII